MAENSRIQRLRFRSWHRGTREMDLLMGSFADKHLIVFSEDELDQYETLLSLGDPDLYSWVTGAEEVPEERRSAVMDLFCAHHYANSAG